MNLLEKCQMWHEIDEFKKIVDALEALPEEEHTPEIDIELARAYNNLAINAEDEKDSQEYLRRALILLEYHHEYFASNPIWYYRIGLTYFCLCFYSDALHYFRQALEMLPDDEDIENYIDECCKLLAMPLYKYPARKRVADAWNAFEKIEGNLRESIDNVSAGGISESTLESCADALRIALYDPAFELGFNGEKYELVLSAEGLIDVLFILVYFKNQAPASILKKWNIRVGRLGLGNLEIQNSDGAQIAPEDVQVLVGKEGDKRVWVKMYCSKLCNDNNLKDKKDFFLAIMLDQVLGEVAAIALIAKIETSDKPFDKPSCMLNDLPKTIESMGLIINNNPDEVLENSYQPYYLEPIEDRDAIARFDTYQGYSRFNDVIKEYFSENHCILGTFSQSNAVLGFIYFPNDIFARKDKNKKLKKFSKSLLEAIINEAGEDSITFLGEANGLYYDYLDFIAWDLDAVLIAAYNYFSKTDVPYANFSVFRSDVGYTTFYFKEDNKDKGDEDIIIPLGRHLN